MPEKVISDFGGGMNASIGVDKLKDNECLLAENVRFDEEGNVLITGANSIQNATAISDGTSSVVHSLFFDPSLGAVAGVGTAILAGARFGALSTSTAAKNPQSAKMSFGPALNRIYMDIGGTGYWMNPFPSNLITVDWAPPSVAGATVTGPTTAGTGTTTTTAGFTTWDTASNIISTSSYATVTGTDGFDSTILKTTGFGFAIGTSAVTGISVTLALNLSDSKYVNPDYPNGPKFIDPSGSTIIYVQLLKNGSPIGSIKSKTYNWPASAVILDFSFGGSTDIWGWTPVQADINNANFGFQVWTQNNGIGVFNNRIRNGRISIYQGSGLAAAVGAAGTLTGTYTWKVTFVAQAGEESDASNPSNSVVLTAQQGTLTSIPVGDGRTASRNVYRKGNTLSSYYLVGSVADNVTTTFADNQTDLAALTTGIILAGDTVGDEPNTRLGNQVVRFPCLHYDRIFWASGNMLVWSKPLNGFAYPADFSTSVGDGKSISGIFSMGGELFILKTDTIWRMSGTDENSFILSKTLSPVGTDWPFTAVISGGIASGFYITGRILFANSRGLWAFNGYTSNKLTPKLDLWFRQDDRTGISLFGNTGFHPPEIYSSMATALASAAANPLFYYLAYAEAGQTTPTAMLVLDLERGAISKRPFAAQSLITDSGSGFIYGGNASGNIYKLDDWTVSDAGLGANVNMDFQDKYRDLGLRGSRMALWGLEFMLATNGQSVTPSVYFDDGTANESLAAISTAAQQPAKVFRKMASATAHFCRNFSFRLNYQGISVNSGSIPNIRLVHVKAYYEPREARARTGESP